jgi:hypothetical protein
MPEDDPRGLKHVVTLKNQYSNKKCCVDGSQILIVQYMQQDANDEN